MLTAIDAAIIPQTVSEMMECEDIEAECGCPECGNRKFDLLEWNEDGTLTCMECSAVYNPNDGF